MPWEPINVDSQIVAIHAALLPTSPDGDILLFGDWDNLFTQNDPPFTAWRIFRVNAGTVEIPAGAVTPDRDLFCAGHAFLADGRLVVGGGNLLNNEVPSGDRIHGDTNMFGGGERACWLYHPRKQTWIKGGDLNLAPDGSDNSGGRWYAILVTLANGKIFTAGGHPDLRESYLYQPTPDETAERWDDTDPSTARRNNNAPEVYSPTTSQWSYLEDAEKTAPNYVSTDSYPRFKVMPSGHLFCDTAGPSRNNNVTNGVRRYNPYSGAWVGPEVNSASLPFSRGSSTTSVLLPLLPPSYGARVMACNASTSTAHYLDVVENSSTTLGWRATSARDGTSTLRRDGCAVLLPTGQVFLTGGSRDIPHPDPPDDDPGAQVEEAVVVSEMYTPSIDWSAGAFHNYNQPSNNQDGEWETLGDEAQDVGRGYHSVALLLPDGTVWTAGTTEGTDDVGLERRELRMEIYKPWYTTGTRPGIDKAPPVVAYGDEFPVELASTQTIARVALVRCGSITHAYDFDQRYVGVTYTQNGKTLTVTAPPGPTVAPPGYYMLWVINNAGRPCTRAKFVRLCPVDAYFALELSTYSLNAVRALKLQDPSPDAATFSGAIQLFYQSFLPHELDIPNSVPEITWRFSNGDAVPGMRIEPSSGNPGWQVDPVEYPDIAQKFTFVYDVVFDDEASFATFDDDKSRKVLVKATLGDYELEVDLTLMKKANPYMKDGHTPWLSTDLRVFTAPVADVNATGTPQLYLQDVLASYNNALENSSHPFRGISTSQQDNPVVLHVPQGDEGVYNFAVARVSYLSIPGDNATGVKVFFRLFNTVGTALEYNPATYPVLGSGGTAIPGLGKQGLSITSIPFFAEPRVTPGAEMDGQPDNALNRQSLFGDGPKLDVAYFGCWLDINVLTPHFPWLPVDDGPFVATFPGDPFHQPVPMLDHIRGYHQCLVAEIYYGDDPTDPGDTPFTSDNLAQRNLATVPAANPGLAITRTVQTTFEVQPSKATTAALTAAPGVATFEATHGLMSRGRFRPDELIFRRNDLPPGVFVTLYMPDVSVDEVLAIAEARLAAPVFERVDEHTLRFELGTATFVPLPGSRKTRIPGLMSVELPDGIQAGQVFTLPVQQYSGKTLRFLGAFQLSIPVDHKANLLAGEVRKLALLRYVAQAMPTEDRWYGIFKRYLGEIADRVRGFGGNPDDVKPSPYQPRADPDSRPGDARGEVHYEGKVLSLLYDCYGDFEGFVLDLCPGKMRFHARERAIEHVIDRACQQRRRVTVTVLERAKERARPYRIQVHC